MKEIKFRAYEKHHKVMDYTDKGLRVDCSDGELYVVNEQGDFEDYVLMQFTGLRDKNCKEIYEGDIIKTYQTANNRTEGFEGKIFEIKWKDGTYECLRKNEAEELHVLVSYGMVEVIGNIYENKELFAKKDTGVKQ